MKENSTQEEAGVACCGACANIAAGMFARCSALLICNTRCVGSGGVVGNGGKLYDAVLLGKLSRHFVEAKVAGMISGSGDRWTFICVLFAARK